MAETPQLATDTRVTKDFGKGAPFDCCPQGCPCGYLTDPKKECHCTPRQVQAYMGRISGPLLDRIDIQVEVPAVNYRDLRNPIEGEPSSTIRERVTRAREMQKTRFKSQTLRSPERSRGGEGGETLARRSPGEGGKTFCNARMTNRLVKKHCKIDGPAETVLSSAMQSFSLSARAYTKILKLSRTIADLDGAEEIRTEHVTEAIQYRSLDRNLWA